MLTHPTLDLLQNLGLHGMAKGFKELDAQPEARSLEHAEWLALLLEQEKMLECPNERVMLLLCAGQRRLPLSQGA